MCYCHSCTLFVLLSWFSIICFSMFHQPFVSHVPLSFLHSVCVALVIFNYMFPIVPSTFSFPCVLVILALCLCCSRGFQLHVCQCTIDLSFPCAIVILALCLCCSRGFQLHVCQCSIDMSFPCVLVILALCLCLISCFLTTCFFYVPSTFSFPYALSFLHYVCLCPFDFSLIVCPCSFVLSFTLFY